MIRDYKLGRQMKFHSIWNLLPIGLMSLLQFSNITVATVFATSSNWSEVARFTGSGQGTKDTADFTCDHVEWRLRWEIVPVPEPNIATMGIHTEQRIGESPEGELIDVIARGVESEQNNGIKYFHDKEGTFYLLLSYADLESYTIIIEQDLNSIPEFPSLLILPLFLIVTLVGLTLRKKIMKHFLNP